MRGDWRLVLCVRNCHVILAKEEIEMLKLDMGKHSYWQQVFSQSKVNGALYQGEQLPGMRWEWPKNTYLQRRLRYSRPYISNDKRSVN